MSGSLPNPSSDIRLSDFQTISEPGEIGSKRKVQRMTNVASPSPSGESPSRITVLDGYPIYWNLAVWGIPPGKKWLQGGCKAIVKDPAYQTLATLVHLEAEKHSYKPQFVSGQ